MIRQYANAALFVIVFAMCILSGALVILGIAALIEDLVERLFKWLEEHYGRGKVRRR